MHERELARVDPHNHSRYSVLVINGEYVPEGVWITPSQIVMVAKCMDFIPGISDHNSFAGWEEFKEAGERFGIPVVLGIEISAQEGHVLGVGMKSADGIPPYYKKFEEAADWIRANNGFVVVAHPDKNGNAYSLSHRQVYDMAERGGR